MYLPQGAANMTSEGYKTPLSSLDLLYLLRDPSGTTLPFTRLRWCWASAQRSPADAERGHLLELVVDEAHERHDDDRHLVRVQRRRELEAQALPPAGGHDHEDLEGIWAAPGTASYKNGHRRPGARPGEWTAVALHRLVLSPLRKSSPACPGCKAPSYPGRTSCSPETMATDIYAML